MANEINIVVSAQVGDATKGLQQVQQQVQRVDRQIKSSTKVLSTNANQYNRNAVATNKWAKGALQQAGYQVGDFAVQLSGGQNALQAFGQQGSQLLGIFGPIGAVLGAGVAIFAAFGVAVQRSGAEVSEMGKALGVLQEPLSAVANTIKGISGSFGSAFPAIIQNIDTALIAAGLFAGFMAAKMVPSMIAASGAGGILSSAMVTVRASVLAASLSAGKFSAVMVTLRSVALLTGAAFKALGAVLMRFLPIAVLLGLAKAVEMFLQLRKGAGGTAVAFGLLRDVAIESFQRIRMNAERMYLKLSAGINGFKQDFINALIPIGQTFDKFVNNIVDKFNSAFPEGGPLSVLRLTVSPEFGSELESASTEIQSSIDAANDRIKELDEALAGPSQSISDLRDAFRNGATDIDIFGSAVEEAASGGANAVNKELTPAMKQLTAVGDMVGNSMENALMSMVDGTKSVKDAFRSMASEIIKELYRIFVVKKITGMIGSFIADPAMFGGMGGTSPVNGSVRPMARSFAGGGYTGGGSRSGGLDGKGGYMAMVHPRESIIDHTRGQSAGGVTVVQNINVSTGVQQTVRTEIKTLMPQIANAAKAAVADAKLRGGSYGKAFG